MSREYPNLLCIGAPKSGTTWLARMLGVHPDIYIPAQKELNVLHYDKCAERLDEYRHYFRQAGPERYLGDFSVRYLASPNAPGNTGLYLNDPHVICVVRDPVEQVSSHYWHLRRQNFHQAEVPNPIPTLAEAMERYPGLLIESALYNKHLQRWREIIPDERMFVYDYSRLAEPTRLLNDIQEFLGLDPVALEPPPQDAVDERRGVQPKGGFLGRIYPGLYAAITRGPYLWMKKALGVETTENIKRWLGLSQMAQQIFFEPGYPSLAKEEKEMISQLFAEDQAAFDRSILRN